MKQEYLEDALQEISDEHLEEAVEWKGEAEVKRQTVNAPRRKPEEKSSKNMYYKRKKSGWKAAIALVTAAAVIVGVVLGTGGFDLGRESSVLKAYAISEAEYPEMSQYPDPAEYGLQGEWNEEKYDAWDAAYDVWWSEQRTRRNLTAEFGDSLDGFWAQSIPGFLSGSGSENRVYSPVNVYMALAMLAEITDGSSRQQILDLLGVKDVEALRKQSSAVWTANYIDDGASASILASSLWLSDKMEYVKSTLDTLAETYHASSYQGEMGSEKMDLALQTWLNEQTGGLLEEYVQQEELSPETILALATTIYYQAKWTDEFFEQMNEEGVFHSLTGDVDCEFMYDYIEMGGTYYWGEKFGAVEKTLDNGHSMWFILPDDGVSVDELLQEAETMKFLMSKDWENSKTLKIHFYLPKFDVSSRMDLSDGLKALGVTDVFERSKADFSPVTAREDVYLTEANHAARVMVDEEGVTAAAYTVMEASGGAPPPVEEIEFKLDRPFLFAIMGTGEVPLFVGVVNQP